MDLSRTPSSTNFQDLTPYDHTNQGRTMLSALFDMTHPDGAPGGYQKWLTDTLNTLTPQDYYLMKNHGVSLEALLQERALKNHKFEMHYEAYPYTEDYANSQIINLKKGRK